LTGDIPQREPSPEPFDGILLTRELELHTRKIYFSLSIQLPKFARCKTSVALTLIQKYNAEGRNTGSDIMVFRN
jgi:hypothetical protein